MVSQMKQSRVMLNVLKNPFCQHQLKLMGSVCSSIIAKT